MRLIIDFSRILLCIQSSRAQYVESPERYIYFSSHHFVLGIGETLSVELAPFSIKVLIVIPGAFRTEGIYGQKFFSSNSIPEYDEMRHATVQRFSSIPGKEKGDPVKAMEAVVDVVRGEGKAKGRPWPLYLVLGDDADEGIRQKATKLLKHVDQWSDVIRTVNFDE
jgi:NAD(P)-dependent dehydrogenase (short-subunit alcohol dehydrogenase family)